MNKAITWTENLTPSILHQLEKEFNFDFSQSKQKFHIELALNTDRTDPNIALSVKDFYTSISKFANIVGCNIEDLDIIRNTEESDHEVVTHILNVDNCLNAVGYYTEFKGDIYKITGYKDGVYTLQHATDETIEKQASWEYLNSVSWREVFKMIDPVFWDAIFE